jgi:hypothetical protein
LAADDFAAAAKETDDEAKKSLARATEILIRRCKPNGYMPGAGTTRPTLPMRIFTPAQRKEALETLLADARVVAAPKLKAAGFAQEVQGVLAIGPTCADLRALEIAVTGKADETRTAASGLAARAHATVSPVIDLMVTRTDDIRAAAAQERTHRMAYSNAQVAWDHVGLDADDQRRLHIILDTSDDFTRNAGALAAASENADLAADVARTKKLAERAKSMLDYNWHTAQPIPESVGN